MTPIEAAIQAATNAGTAHGFAQALEQVCNNLNGSIHELNKSIEASAQGTDQEELQARREVMVAVLGQIMPEMRTRQSQVEQLQRAASATAAAALQSVPDMAKIRGAVAVLMGAG